MSSPYATDDHTADRDEEQRRFARARSLLRLLIIVCIALMLAMMGTVVLLASAIHETQITGTPTGRKLLDAAERIQSCTTPTRKCAKENQRATAKLITGLTDNQTRAAAAAAACAARSGVDGYDEILACMVTLTRAGQPTPRPH